MTGPTLITPAPPYYQVATTHWLVVSAVASGALEPTLTELQAGSDITADIVGVTGFTKTSNNLPVNRMNNLTTGMIPGRNSRDDSSFTLVADKDGADQRATFTEGLETFVVKLEDNFETGSVMSVYSVRVSTVNQPSDLDNAATFTVNMTVVDANEGQTVPAA